MKKENQKSIEEENIKILSYNILAQSLLIDSLNLKKEEISEISYFNIDYRFDKIFEKILELSPDICLFQEYENNYNSKRMPLRPISPYAKIEPQKLKVGDSVYNEKFGEGVIVKLYGKVYEVQFNNTKQLTSDVVPFVKIKTHK